MDACIWPKNIDDKVVTTGLGAWEINHLSFCKPENAHKNPVVFIGGAFQKFASFRKEVEHLWEDFPVILLDLPGQGGNKQSGKAMGFKDYGDLVAQWMDRQEIVKISAIASSYGSAIGFYLASRHPERVDKLILAGTTPKLRSSVKMLLEESLRELEKGDMSVFSEGVVLTLLNYSKRKLIKGSGVLRRGLHRSIRELTYEDCRNYIENTRRLLDLDDLGGEVHCETLVLAGEWDNFTTPWEGFSVSKHCTRSIFGVVRDTDHLGPYEKKDLANKIYRHFLLGESLEQVQDLELFRGESYPKKLRQMEPRYLLNGAVRFENSRGEAIPAIIEDINIYGCRISCNEQLKEGEFYQLHLTEENLVMPVVLFGSDENGLKGLFLHCNLKRAKSLESYVNRVAKNDLSSLVC